MYVCMCLYMVCVHDVSLVVHPCTVLFLQSCDRLVIKHNASRFAMCDFVAMLSHTMCTRRMAGNCSDIVGSTASATPLVVVSLSSSW